MTRALLFWIIASLLVVSAAPISVKLAAIVITSYAYMRMTGHAATLDHALFVGAAWFMLDIIADLATSHVLDLTACESKPIVRGATFLVWLMSPAVFARNDV